MTFTTLSSSSAISVVFVLIIIKKEKLCYELAKVQKMSMVVKMYIDYVLEQNFNKIVSNITKFNNAINSVTELVTWNAETQPLKR